MRSTIALAISALVTVFASTSAAQEAQTVPVQQTPPPAAAAQPVAPAPAAPQQQAPIQTTTIQQPAPPPPTSTTTTTAAPYAPQDRFSERKVEKLPNRPLLSTGGTLLVLSYGSSVVAGAVSDRDEDKRLFIPVVGPWLDLGQRDCDRRACGEGEDLAKAMIVTSGVVQGAGVLLALGSLLIPETTRIEERTTTAKATPPKPEVKLLPVSFRAGAGLGAVGRF